MGVSFVDTNIFLEVFARKVESRRNPLQVLELYENSSIDWVDCVNALLMKKKELKEIYSYDKHYDKFDWIVRQEP